ncbi:MAG: family 20 glycosylhydrolase [Verrucomicrobia bacterium]|nr:family 20 glycosylhydrolase [Cytophagales bacterium]
MKKILFLLLLTGFINVSAQNPAILPIPVSMQTGTGKFVFSQNTSILIPAGNEQAKNTAQYLIDKTKTPMGMEMKVSENQSATNTIKLVLNKPEDKTLKTEGFNLEVSDKEISIRANTNEGLFYGVQTLLQLLPAAIESKNPVKNTAWAINAIKITDYPRFEWRGIMLDVSRHFFGKEDVKKYIDELARYKFNTFHWHLVDDNGWRIEIKSLPELTQVGAWRVERTGRWNARKDPQPNEPATYGGFYTQDDIREVVKYAQARHITIVPEIDVPGHSMAVLAAYPELSCTKEKVQVNPGSKFAEWYGNGEFKMLVDNTLNPSDEKVYEFLDKVFTEVAALFPGKYIHMGGDECYHGYWEKDAGCQALMKKMKMQKVTELQSYFVKRVEKIITNHGKTLIGWDEILEGGLAPNAAVMNWRGIEVGIKAAQEKHKVVMTPNKNCYIDLFQGDPYTEMPTYASTRLKDTYNWNPVPAGIDSSFIMGGQGNLWSESVPTFRQIEYMSFPRAFALAEVYWSPQNKRIWEDFISRIEQQFIRLEQADIKFARCMYEPILKVEKVAGDKIQVSMTPEVSNLDFYYTTDSTFPDHFSPTYQKPVVIPDGADYMRVVTYRNGKAIGKTLSLPIEELKRRAGK